MEFLEIFTFFRFFIEGSFTTIKFIKTGFTTTWIFEILKSWTMVRIFRWKYRSILRTKIWDVITNIYRFITKPFDTTMCFKVSVFITYTFEVFNKTIAFIAKFPIIAHTLLRIFSKTALLNISRFFSRFKIWFLSTKTGTLNQKSTIRNIEFVSFLAGFFIFEFSLFLTK